MSVADLKTRMADVPGIHSLTMAIEAGRIMLRWGDHSAAVDATASDVEIEAAIRDAIKLPPVALIPEKQNAGETMPSAVPAQPSSKPMSTQPAHAGLSVKQMMEDHAKQMADIHAAQIEILKSTLARQRDTVANAVGTVASKIDAQTDEFLSIMGQFANDLG